MRGSRCGNRRERVTWAAAKDRAKERIRATARAGPKAGTVKLRVAVPTPDE
jgi:hypothetical protein